MSTSDNVFLASDESVARVAEWLAAVLDLQAVADPELKQDERLLRGSARTSEREIGLLVAPNNYGEVDPEPDEISALDSYPIDVNLRLFGRKDERLQLRETQALLDALVAARPEIPMLLVHNLDTLVAAHLPGVGTHTFADLISPDAPDIEAWRPWVIGS
ncbi:hypothetical protein ACIBG5_35020 [Kribbella sp. NPDC050241]|uniref:hypothetical protein n=1 Tax=Kribbella sp. NPDC050241 TaxID=3364115 RepID=UPI0037B28B87